MEKISEANLDHGWTGISCPAYYLLDRHVGFCELNFKHVVQLVTNSFNSSYNPGQYIDCLALFKHFSNLRHPVWRSWIISGCKVYGTVIQVPFSRRPSSIVISSWKVQYGWISFGRSHISWGHPFWTTCLSSANSSSWVVSVWNWFNISAVAGSCLVMAYIFSLGSWILSFWQPSLERQSVSWLVEPFMYWTVKSYWKGHIRSHCSHGVASIKFFARIVSNGFSLLSRVKCDAYRKWWNFSIAHMTPKALSSMVTYPHSASCSNLLAN